MSGQPDGQNLRSSSSGTLAALSSNIDGSLALNGHEGTPDNQTAFGEDSHMFVNSADPGNDTYGKQQGHEAQEEHEYITKRPRHSGGFLLSSHSPLSSRLPGNRKTPNGAQVDVKGKAKAEDTELIVPKRRSLLHRHRLKPSIGSSPLAKEVVHAASAPGSDHNGRSDGDETPSIPSTRASQSIKSSLGSGSTHNGLPLQNSQTDRDAAPALGFDTDATRLVNLALSLSESRRRNISGSLLAPVNAFGDRRVISAGPLSTGVPTSMGGGSLQQHLQQQRRTSRTVSPRADRPAYRGTPSPRPSQAANYPIQAPIVASLDLIGSPDLAFSPSDSTLSRAEKARMALELGYEYRRLLQYLPEIRALPKGKPTSGRLGRKGNDEVLGELGRSYNPLQYIRNRKLRLRERRPLDPEAEGWTDVARVRDWVTAVAGEREAGIATIDDRYPLPRFETDTTQPSTVNPLQTIDGSNTHAVQSSKPRRPRLDWTFTPWDLLADAYWLQHDGNTMHIEDRAGHKILSNPQRYKAPSARISAELDRASRRPSDSISRQVIPPEIHRPLVDNAQKETSRERSHQQPELSEPETPSRNVDGHKERKARWPRRLVRSRSSSSLSDSGHEDTNGYRRRRRQDQNYLDSAALEKHMRKLLEQELEGSGISTTIQVNKDDKYAAKGNDPHETSNQNSTDGVARHLQSSSKGMHNRIRSNSTARSAQPSARTSLDERKGRRPRISLDDDLDATGPESSTVDNFIPSISIDMSRPKSPQTSPQKLSPARKELRSGRSKERQAISEADFALGTEPLPQNSMIESKDSKTEEAASKDQRTKTMNGFLSPTTAEGLSRRFRRSDGKPTKESSESDSKFRGFFKSGRIAEIVGNEVTRVGDRLWRKDVSNQASPIASPTSSIWGESDTEGDEVDSSPDNNISRTATRYDGLDSAKTDSPKYHMANLPSFRSPFKKDKEDPEFAEEFFEQSAQPPRPLQQQERGRSNRFDRLAPPKLDMRNVSPSASPPRTRTQTRNTVASYDPFDSRQSSTSRSEGRVRDADRRLNAVLGIPGTVGRGGPPITGLAILESHRRRSRGSPALEGKRAWSIADQSVSVARGAVTKRDIARVRALLLSSRVKANEIVRHAHEASGTPSPVLQDLQKTSLRPLPRVSRSEEHNLAARVHANNIDDLNQQLRDSVERFSNGALDSLHKQIKDIDKRVTQELTPSVRTCADQADAFSAQLTTTHVLEVKQLNDSVDAILRRRRRRLRWIRRGGYVLLEWTLLGIMWWVWLVVAVIRLIRGIIRGFIAAIRWLLWL